MYYINELSNNAALMCAIICWFVAQVLKTILHTVLTRSFIPERLVGTGGMPSSHSATVCGLATAVFLKNGPASSQFAIAAILAGVVMYDALGIRRQAGKHAQILNELIENVDRFQDIDWETLSPDERLKEFLGHTPLQVLAGLILGIALSAFLCQTVFL
ncbi:MAG: divergent PAP2 family protein [Lachnospiraceae bacterium]|nr:divergent PAP2 family protein [Lachnospiraceae bacterium]